MHPVTLHRRSRSRRRRSTTWSTRSSASPAAAPSTGRWSPVTPRSAGLGQHLQPGGRRPAVRPTDSGCPVVRDRAGRDLGLAAGPRRPLPDQSGFRHRSRPAPGSPSAATTRPGLQVAQRVLDVQPLTWVQLNGIFRNVFPDLIDDPDARGPRRQRSPIRGGGSQRPRRGLHQHHRQSDQRWQLHARTVAGWRPGPLVAAGRGQDQRRQRQPVAQRS